MPRIPTLTRERELYLVAYIVTVKTSINSSWVDSPKDVHDVITMDDGVEDITLNEIKAVWKTMCTLGFFNKVDGFQVL
jgi:hypothetical protein